MSFSAEYHEKHPEEVVLAKVALLKSITGNTVIRVDTIKDAEGNIVKYTTFMEPAYITPEATDEAQNRVWDYIDSQRAKVDVDPVEHFNLK